LAGKSVWPQRFSDADLARRELSYGRSGFALQFLLDTSLSDQDRYPLKLSDLIVDGLDQINGPDIISWGNDSKLIHNELPMMGFDGNRFYGPANKGTTYSRYNSITAFLDPSGRGGDETALAIVAELHGRLFLLYCNGWRDGYGPDTLKGIANTLVQLRVGKVLIEDNFGDGMFLALITPHIIKAWKDAETTAKRTGQPWKDDDPHGTTIEGIRSPRVQKELRILSVLEPATQQHRLVVSASVIEQDYTSVKKYTEVVGSEAIQQYSLIHQMSHLTREKDSLLHDDRIESLSGAVAQYASLLGIDSLESAERLREEREEEELLRLLGDDLDEAIPGQRSNQRWDRTKNPIRPS
jgi:hypothetical protein